MGVIVVESFGWLSVVTILVSAVLTGVLLRFGSVLGLIHEPKGRSSHSTLIPHGGGMGIVVAFVFAISVSPFSAALPEVVWMVLAGCGGLIAVIGFCDDIGHIAIRWRLLTQVVCVGVGTWLLGGFFSGHTNTLVFDYGLINFSLAVFLLVWWLNLFNFMDGIDGLAALEAIFIALGAVIVLWVASWLPVSDLPSEAKLVELLLMILAASVLGFLMFNWSPAKIFMGDVGSTFLGFTLGMIALVSVTAGAVSFCTWLILGGVFWVDATLTLLQRMAGGERWYEAHRSHAYQHAALMFDDRNRIKANRMKRQRLGVIYSHSHRTVCLMVLVINLCWLLPLAILAVIIPDLEILILIASWLPLFWIAYRLDAGQRGKDYQ